MRVFLAVDLDAKVKSGIASMIERLKGSNGALKWVKPENIHVTLYFFGEVTEKDCISLQQLLKKALKAIHPFTISVKGVAGFPSLLRPRVLWVGIDNPTKELETIYSLVSRHLQESTIGISRDTKGYTPHVTVARIKGPFNRYILRKLEDYREHTFGCFQVNNVVLYQSILQRQGPLYEPLKIYEL